MAGELYVRKASGLVREVGPFTVMSIGAAYVICDGFYYFTVQAPYFFPGAHLPLALGIAGIMLAFSTLCIMFLTVAMPRAGGDYIHVSRVIHPLLGYFCSWQVWQGNTLVAAVVACTTTIFFGHLFYTIGFVTKSDWWLRVGEALTAPLEYPAIYIGFAVGVLVVCWILLILGMRVYRWWVDILFLIPLVGGIVTLATDAYLLAGGLDLIKRGWDATFGAGAWDEIINVALANGWEDYVAGAYGWPGKWTWSGTFAALVSSGYAWWGLGMANYVAGEVREPTKAFVIGLPAAIFVVGAYYLIGGILLFGAYGSFISMYDYVILGGFSDQLTINPGLMPTFSLFTYGPILRSNPVVAIIISVAAAFWMFNDIPLFPLVSSRIMFAWAFDRMFPEIFARVHPRFHSPVWSINVCMIAQIIGVFLTWWSPWFLGMICFAGVFWRYLLSSLAAMILPYSRPELFERGLTWRIGRLPVVTLVGTIAVALNFYLMFPVMEWILSDMSFIAYNVGWWVFSMVLFIVFYERNMARGINMSELYKAIPPG